MQKQKFSLFSIPSENTYIDNLDQVTRIAVWCNAVFLGAYTIVYVIQGFWAGLWGNLAAFLFALLSVVLAERQRRMRMAAHVAVFSFFLSLVGSIFLNGGLNSPSLPWLVFMILFATLTAGTLAGLIWSVVALILLFVIFGLQASGVMMWEYIPTLTDRLVEFLGVLASTGLAALWGEHIKRRQFQRQEAMQNQLRLLSTTDPLTGAYNRRYFFQAAADLITRARPLPSVLMMIDVDWFKKVNDTRGHMAGDQVLKQLVQVLLANLRRTDLLARMGGEEFVILLPRTSLADGLDIAARLHRVTQTALFETDAGWVDITISIGLVAVQPQELLTLDEHIRRADQAMYGAKEAGRNQVHLWEEGTSRVVGPD